MQIFSAKSLDQGCPKFLHGGPYCTFHELSRATQLFVKCLTKSKNFEAGATPNKLKFVLLTH